VITGLFGAIPLVGEPIQHWLLGGFAPDQPTLTRFFSLHYLLPFVIAGVIILHIWALHIQGSGNPTGVDVKAPQDTIPFHPYYTAKDGYGAGLFMIGLAILVFFLPNWLGHPVNYVPANPLSTPAHITPEWYFWPYYAILRAFTVDFLFIPAKLVGVAAMFASILLLFFLPWLDKSPVRSGSYRPTFKIFFVILLIDIFVLGWMGGLPPEEPYVMISQVATIYYFAHFLLILPVLSMVERTLPLPNSISESVLHGEAAEAAPAKA
jgi:ubiquinol-cytochrome c reductase cytochrome b subunit